ncbi:hypothetical protein [Aliiroseovarius sp.]|uniref:hypothetical protein n=1 Tax=Aliiroseovarius sp. TaxID=1872442 RepID=UPI002603EAC1|nr:hypothetical protein [Aliiroseovarius sp.]
MPSNRDLEERKSTTRLFLIIAIVVVALVVVLLVFVAPSVSAALAPGVGLKGAAISAFLVTLVVIVVLMLTAGDGLIGEIQFTLPAFFVFFLLIWVLIAWVF